ncbi:MAG: tetratricopeptide repeat protein [Anaerolineae bacterium]|nr:tetratricopeptide repeat protein [Anaerolineae bacterium]
MPNLIPHFIHEQFQAGNKQGTFQAVALLVDVTGFTALTEELMQRGKEGAETLTATLNAVFNPLVESVYTNGGFITSFAGDAFTALFPMSSEAEIRAVFTAFTVQKFFSQYTGIQTPTGDFPFGVNIGLGMGAVEWGIIGGAEGHTFYFRGEAIEGCTAAEAVAGVGQIVAAPGFMRENPPQITAQPLGDFVLLTGGDVHLSPQNPNLTELTQADLTPFVDETVFALDSAAEFRQVATVFISLQGTDRETIEPFVQAVLEAARTYGGYFNKLDFGDKGGMILVAFGAPVARENNLPRAADFLLALRSQPMVWRAGLTFGTVYAGFIGGLQRGEYTIIGDAVNLAARQMSSAAWGEIWVDSAAADRLRVGGYNLETVGMLSFKGKRETVEIAKLVRGSGAEAGATSEIAVYNYALVGRGPQVTRLAAWLEPLNRGRFAGVLTVYGEAGMGKSRLVRELLTGAPNMKWAFCPADEILRQSLNPFRYFLRRYFDQSPERSIDENRARFETVLNELSNALTGERAADLRAELERTRSFLGALIDLHWTGSLYEQIDPKLRFENTLSAVKALVLAESTRRPFVLHIEDYHWLDADSGELLKTLTRNVADYPIAVLMTSRYQDSGEYYPLPVDAETPSEVLDLTPLTGDEMRRLAGQILRGEVDDRLVELLLGKANGNPFFVEQLALDLRERQALTKTDNDVWSISQQQMEQIPVSINDVLVARLDRLAAQVKTVVQTAAVLGQEFEVRVLSSMLRGDADIDEKVKKAEREAIWSSLNALRYLFKHALLRDAAYDMQLRARLRDLHALAAEAIQQVYADDLPAHYADLVYHFNRAGDHVHEQQYAVLAGEQAAARFANLEATTYFTRALELTPEDDRAGRFAILKAREKVYELQGERETQMQDIQTLTALADQLDDKARQAEAGLRRLRYAEVTGDFASMAEVAQQVIALLPGDAANEAAGRFQWGVALYRLANYAEAREQLHLAYQLAESAGLKTIQADALRSNGAVRIYQGGFSEGLGVLEQAVALYLELGDRRGVGSCYNNLGGLNFNLGDYPRALEWMEKAMVVFHEIGDRYGESITTGNMGSIYGLVNQHWKGIGYIERALQLSREIGNRMAELQALGNAGSILLMMGDMERAESYLHASLELGKKVGERQRIANSLSSLGMLHFQRGDLTIAADFADRALQLALEIDSPAYESLSRTVMGHMQEASGQPEEATASYQHALELNIQIEEFHLAAEPRAGLARLAMARGDLATAVGYVNDILTHLESGSLDGTSEPVRVCLTCYHILKAADDPRAEDMLMRARTIFATLADAIPDPAARQRLIDNIPAHRELQTL